VEATSSRLPQTVADLYRRVHQEFRKAVAGLDHAALNRRPHPEANSIAILVIHTLGSEAECLRAVRGIPTDRDRASEFTAQSASADDLNALLDAADRDLAEHCANITAADLVASRRRGDREPRPGLEMLINNYGHAREHLAVLELTKQVLDLA
jgi:DinB family protein